MSSPPRTAREEEQRVNLRTLVIASAASATAALVTSRLWIAGTWIAAAVTPVLVTLISELLRRPTERIARGITTDRAALPDPEAPALRPESAAAQRVAERLRSDLPPLPDPEAPAPGPPAPTRIYRSEAARARPRRRRIAYNVVFGTAALAFVIGVLALTAGELLGGGSVGDNDRRTTLIGGSSRNDSSDRDQTRDQQNQPADTETEEQPEQTTPTETTPETETTPAPTTPEGEQPGEPLPPETTPTTPTTPQP